jgi:hypothetical protein
MVCNWNVVALPRSPEDTVETETFMKHTETSVSTPRVFTFTYHAIVRGRGSANHQLVI